MTPKPKPKPKGIPYKKYSVEEVIDQVSSKLIPELPQILDHKKGTELRKEDIMKVFHSALDECDNWKQRFKDGCLDEVKGWKESSMYSSIRQLLPQIISLMHAQKKLGKVEKEWIEAWNRNLN
jgi:hypothetical protein